MEDMRYSDLIARVKERDQAAMHELYTETRNDSYFLAKTYLKNEKDIVSVLQDAYILILGRIHRYNLTQSLEQWIHGIIATLSIRKLKQNKVKLGTKEQVLPFNRNEEFIPEEWMEQADRRRDVMRFIEGMEPGPRMVLLLSTLGEMSLPEISERMGISLTEVQSHLSSARQTLEMQIPAGTPASPMPYGATPRITLLLKAEAQQTSMPLDMAKTIYQQVMLFFMSGGKVPDLDEKQPSSGQDKGGGFLLNVLPILIMIVAVAMAMVFYGMRYKKNDQIVAKQLVSEYHQSKQEALAKGESWPGVPSPSSDPAETTLEQETGWELIES